MPEYADPIRDRLGDRVHQVLDKTVAFAALLSADGRVKDVSQNALLAAGISLEDVEGRPFWEGYWFSHDQDVQDRMRLAVERGRAGETTRFDYVARIRDDALIDVDFQMAPIFDETGAVVELLASGFDVTERTKTRERLEESLREASHRVKNILATVMAMARMTSAYSPPDRAISDFIERLETLTSAHRVLGTAGISGAAPFEVLANQVLRPYLDRFGVQVVIRGDARPIRRDPGKLLALCLHELATNAVRHGAHSGGDGKIDVALKRHEPSGVTSFYWVESLSGRQPTESRGYGLRFIPATLRQVIGGETHFEFSSNGLRVEVSGDAPGLWSSPLVDSNLA